MFNLIFGKGREKILLTKSEYKRARNRYKKRKRKFGLCRDSDGDGSPDFLDGFPFNPKKHSFVTAVASGAGSVIAGEVVKRAIHEPVGKRVEKPREQPLTNRMINSIFSSNNNRKNNNRRRRRY